MKLQRREDVEGLSRPSNGTISISRACTCRVAGLPSHHTQHSGALTEAMAAPALNNIDRRQDCARWKDKAMRPSPNAAR